MNFSPDMDRSMLRSESKTYPKMTLEQRRDFELALREETAAKADNVAAAKAMAPRVRAAVDQAMATVRELRTAREQLGLSLADLEKRTGTRKSALSRLENSKAPNPMLATLVRYAEAIGKRIDVSMVEANESSSRGSLF